MQVEFGSTNHRKIARLTKLLSEFTGETVSSSPAGTAGITFTFTVKGIGLIDSLADNVKEAIGLLLEAHR